MVLNPFQSLLRPFVLAVSLILCPGLASAQESPFARGWTLQNDGSSLDFQSVKNMTKVESSSFARFSGAISETGAARITVLLESVDTKIDLRNVRMRFLFFESFQYPEATITAQIDPAMLADLAEVRRKTLPLAYTLDLHGKAKSGQADVVVTLLSDDQVSVATKTPINVAAADHNLMGGIEKLEEAAKVDIIPSASVTFNFLFVRNPDPNAAASGEDGETPLEPEAEAPVSAALETEGDFSSEECLGRFEILSRTDNIYFASGSARLQAASTPLLDTLADVMSRCPGLVVEVGGHTDSVGSAAANQRLSERRAEAVVSALLAKGIDPSAMVAKGYGETRPKADNATRKGRLDNRRIEFVVIKGGA